MSAEVAVDAQPAADAVWSTNGASTYNTYQAEPKVVEDSEWNDAPIMMSNSYISPRSTSQTTIQADAQIKPPSARSPRSARSNHYAHSAHSAHGELNGTTATRPAVAVKVSPPVSPKVKVEAEVEVDAPVAAVEADVEIKAGSSVDVSGAVSAMPNGSTSPKKSKKKKKGKKTKIFDSIAQKILTTLSWRQEGKGKEEEGQKGQGKERKEGQRRRRRQTRQEKIKGQKGQKRKDQKKGQKRQKRKKGQKRQGEEAQKKVRAESADFFSRFFWPVKKSLSDEGRFRRKKDKNRRNTDMTGTATKRAERDKRRATIGTVTTFGVETTLHSPGAKVPRWGPFFFFFCSITF